jgi:hypothetical protein
MTRCEAQNAVALVLLKVVSNAQASELDRQRAPESTTPPGMRRHVPGRSSVYAAIVVFRGGGAWSAS